MTHNEIEALNLQSGDPITLKVKHREEVYSGQFIRLYADLILWKTQEGERGKALDQIISIEKTEEKL